MYTRGYVLSLMAATKGAPQVIDRFSAKNIPDRRTFLAHGTAAFLAAAAPPLAAGANSKSMPIVDTHQHLWDLDKFRLPWLENVDEVLKKSYLTEDYLAETKGLNIVQAVYMEVDVAPEQQIAEAEHVIKLAKSPNHPTAAAVISGRLHEEGFRPYIARFGQSQRLKDSARKDRLLSRHSYSERSACALIFVFRHVSFPTH